jgi:hypothetical protein
MSEPVVVTAAIALYMFGQEGEVFACKMLDGANVVESAMAIASQFETGIPGKTGMAKITFVIRPEYLNKVTFACYSGDGFRVKPHG